MPDQPGPCTRARAAEPGPAGRTYYSGFMGRSRVMLLSAGGREHKGATVRVWNRPSRCPAIGSRPAV